VTAGVHTETDNVMTQRAYAERFPAHAHPDGVQVLLEEIKRHPGEITLIAIGPLFNIGAAIDRDPETFRKLHRVVMMGGSVERGYGLAADGSPRPPEPEWNIDRDPKSAAKLFAVGVPIFMMPLDSTQIPLETAARDTLFAAGNPITDQLTLLYHQWVANTPNHSPTPTLFDPVAVAFAFRPELCPVTPMRIEVDDKGLTRKIEGQPNAQVCLKSDEKAFLTQLTGRHAGGGVGGNHLRAGRRLLADGAQRNRQRQQDHHVQHVRPGVQRQYHGLGTRSPLRDAGGQEPGRHVHGHGMAHRVARRRRRDGALCAQRSPRR
jgi:inosine-uridine nucleoside N-ribohydrolase